MSYTPVKTIYIKVHENVAQPLRERYETDDKEMSREVP